MATQQLSDTLSKLHAIVEPVLEREGFDLVDLEYRRGPKRDLLRILMDRADRETYGPLPRNPDGTLVDAAGSVTLDDCVRVSHLLSPALDVEDVVGRAYTFEVSSPGVDRPLTKPLHFERAKGLRVKVKTRVPIDGKALFVAKLAAAGDDGIVLDEGGAQVEVPYRLVAKANIEFEY